MEKYLVTETTEVRTSYHVEAKSAAGAIRNVKNSPGTHSHNQTFEQHFVATEIEEEFEDVE